MRLNLKPIIHASGEHIPFSFSMDLRDVEISGQHPVCEPVLAEGLVRNQADVLLLDGQLQTALRFCCDRCGTPFSQEMILPLHFVLAEEVAGEETDEILLLDKGELDLEEPFYASFILEMDTKHLCSQHCKGLCPGCGANLNKEACRCKAASDPRWSKLTQLLD